MSAAYARLMPLPIFHTLMSATPSPSFSSVHATPLLIILRRDTPVATPFFAFARCRRFYAAAAHAADATRQTPSPPPPALSAR
jgi:hypothetical protein